MKQLDPKLVDAVKRHFPALTDADKLDMCWLMKRPEARGGDQWMMKHHWVERIGEKAGVRVVEVDWIVAGPEFSACQVTATLGGDVVITTGEASRHNSTSPYPVAIAEKRGKDRAILKLLGLHGDFLSDEELEARQEKDEKTEKKVVRIAGETEFPFDDFWGAYGKKRGSKHKCNLKWSKLKETERKEIMEHIPAYVAATPDVTFRKDPLTYLNQRVWETEELPTRPTPKQAQATQGEELTYQQMLRECEKLGRITSDYTVKKKSDGSARFTYNG